MKRILLLITLLLTICFSWNRVEAKSIPSREEKGSAGLDHNRFRYYSSETGSYLSKDPIGLAGGNNLYSYVYDSNISIDIFGLNDIPLYRGTTSGYPGNPVLERIQITPTTTDPRIATVFATEAATSSGKPGVVLVAQTGDLKGIGLDKAGNASTPGLANLEKEVAVQTGPTNFSKKASLEIPVDKARGILKDMGYDLPTRVSSKSGIDFELEEISKKPMSQAETVEFNKRAKAASYK